MIKRLFLDIETCPNIGYFWSAGYRVDISYEQIIQERRIITAAWSWNDSKETYDLAWDRDREDKALVGSLTSEMGKADEIVAHYGDGFDLPWVRTRAMKHGIVVPEWKSVDTRAWSARHFYLNSNKLDYLAQFLGIGTKIRTDYDLWKDATGGSDKASKEAVLKMREYNKHDVELLRPVHTKLSLYCPPHTHIGVLNDKEKWTCPRCAGERIKYVKPTVSRTGIIKHELLCGDCPKYFVISNAAYKKAPFYVSPTFTN